MAIPPPDLPQHLWLKALAPVEQPTATDVGEVALALDVAQRSRQETPQLEPPVTANLLGHLDIYQWRLIRSHTRQHYPEDEERVDADIRSRLDMLLKGMEELKDEVKTIKQDVHTIKQEVRTLSTNFGSLAIPIVQRHNAGCVSGINFQKVPFPNGNWPNEEQSRQLSSLTSINGLTVPALQRYCDLYGLNRNGLKAQLLQRIYVHLGVAHVAQVAN